jgi:hypothetical protein
LIVGFFAKETYNLKEPTNHAPPYLVFCVCASRDTQSCRALLGVYWAGLRECRGFRVPINQTDDQCCVIYIHMLCNSQEEQEEKKNTFRNAQRGKDHEVLESK